MIFFDHVLSKNGDELDVRREILFPSGFQMRPDEISKLGVVVAERAKVDRAVAERPPRSLEVDSEHHRGSFLVDGDRDFAHSGSELFEFSSRSPDGLFHVSLGLFPPESLADNAYFQTIRVRLQFLKILWNLRGRTCHCLPR